MSRTHKAAGVFVLLLILSVVAFGQLSQNPPPEPRSTDPTPDVSSSGAFETNVPIVVPVARGPVPSISLNYSSVSTNGIAGVGWSLEGLPAIVRAHRPNGWSFGATDSFVYLPSGLSGGEHPDNRLVTAAGRYYLKKNVAGSPLREFRASTNLCGGFQIGPCSWEMRDGSGYTYYFGEGINNSGASTLWEPQNGVTASRGFVAWGLSKIVDPNGNYLKVVYNNNNGQSFYPKEIEYNLPLAGADPRSMKVTFQYEKRPDLTAMPTYFNVRLKNVRVYEGWSSVTKSGLLVRRYELRYGTSVDSERSLLTGYRMFGVNGDLAGASSLEPVVFRYSSMLASDPDAHRVVTEAPAWSSLESDPFKLCSLQNPNQKDVCMQRCADGTITCPSPDDCDPATDPAQCQWQSLIGDIDADGRDDFVRAYSGGWGARVTFRCGESSGLGKPSVQTDSVVAQGATKFLLADVNGDGRKDLVELFARNGTVEAAVALGNRQGGHCGLGAWVSQPVDTFAGGTMSSRPGDWRALAGDFDADGSDDVALFDKENRTLYAKLARNAGLASATRYRVGVDWNSCLNNVYPAVRGFGGITLADVNGDGRSDVVAEWALGPISGTLISGQLGVLTSLGTATGLATPTERCLTPSTPFGTPAIRYPYSALRVGDVNGDRVSDLTMSYQGHAHPGAGCAGLCDGVVNGRDVRALLGATGVAPRFVEERIEALSYPGPDDPLLNSYGFRNQWDFALADFNGDGVDDYIQSYRGNYGDKLYQALGSPLGKLTNWATLLDTTTAQPDDSVAHYPRSFITAGDFNGDGRQDLARVATSGDRALEIFLGANGGLSNTPAWVSNRIPLVLGGSSNAMQLLSGDINGDGRTDLLLLNNTVQHPSPDFTPPGDSFRGSLAWAMSPAGSETGLPDLMTHVDNGVGGTTTVTYRLTTQPELAAAINPDWPARCWAWDPASQSADYVDDPVRCGRVNGHARPLVQSFLRDNGVARDGRTFQTKTSFVYTNGRTNSDRRDEQVDLGFSEVRRTIDQTGNYSITLLRQDWPYQGLPSSTTQYRAGNDLLSVDSRTYGTSAPFPGVVAAVPETRTLCGYEPDGSRAITRLPCSQQQYLFHPTYLFSTAVREGTPDIPTESDVFTNVSYHVDIARWLFRAVSTWSWRSTTRGTLVLDMRRTTYDPAPGHETRPLKVERALFKDAETAFCKLVDDPWNPSTCLEKFEGSPPQARWVTLFETQANQYDANGNLLLATGLPVVRSGRAVWNHPLTFTYDRTYAGRIASLQNALGQTNSWEYFLATSSVIARDANGRLHTSQTDKFDRLLGVFPPGALQIPKYGYIGWDPGRGYQVNVTTCQRANRPCNESRLFLDGFGDVAETWEDSDLPVGAVSMQRKLTFNGSRMAVWRSLPVKPVKRPDKWIRRVIDEKGRTIEVSRVDANGVVDNIASGVPARTSWAFRTDGTFLMASEVDANGHSTSVSLDYRRRAAQSVDALGNRTLITYGNSLRPVQVTLPAGQTGNVIMYRYDSWGRMISEEDPGRGYRTLEYDDTGHLVSEKRYSTAATTTKSSELSYRYDALDRIVSEGDVNNQGVYTARVTYTYDEPSQTNGVGRLTKVVDESGTQRFGYRARGTLARHVLEPTGLPDSFVYDFDYNDQDQVTTKWFGWSATPLASRTQQEFTYSRDGLLQELQQDNVLWAAWTDFDEFKRPHTRKSYFDGTAWANKMQVSFDVDERVRAISVQDKANTTIQDVAYTYDAVGNVTRVIDNRASNLTRVNGIDTNMTRVYAYDALDRLCGEGISTCGTAQSPQLCTGPQCAANYGFDNLGNITSEATAQFSAATTYTPAGTTLVLENRTTALHWRALHDSEGKRTQFEDHSSFPAITSNYEYDYAGRLRNVMRTGVVREQHIYDFTGRRAKKIYFDGAGRWTTTWFLGDLEVRSDSSQPSLYAKSQHVGGVATIGQNTVGLNGSPTGALLPGQAGEAAVTANIGRPLAGNIVAAPPLGVYLRNTDVLGSQALMTRPADGAEVSRYTYGVWGAPQVGNSLGYDTSFAKFTSQEYEDTSRLLNYGSRFYDPQSRRFLTADDRFTGGSQGFNRFSYVNNNPASLVDPTGHNPRSQGSRCTLCVQVNLPPQSEPTSSGDFWGRSPLDGWVPADAGGDPVHTAVDEVEFSGSDTAFEYSASDQLALAAGGESLAQKRLDLSGDVDPLTWGSLYGWWAATGLIAGGGVAFAALPVWVQITGGVLSVSEGFESCADADLTAIGPLVAGVGVSRVRPAGGQLAGWQEDVAVLSDYILERLPNGRVATRIANRGTLTPSLRQARDVVRDAQVLRETGELSPAAEALLRRLDPKRLGRTINPWWEYFAAFRTW